MAQYFHSPSEDIGLGDVSVPNLIGLTRFMAEQKLKEVGLNIKDSESAIQTSLDKRGLYRLHEGECVASQASRSGSTLAPGASVLLEYDFSGELQYGLDDYSGEIVYRNDKGKIHRESGPAWIYPAGAFQGILYQEEWYIDGKKHREDGPAVLKFRDDGTRGEWWYRNDELHREGGPAISVLDTKGKVTYREYYQQGKLHRVGGPAAFGILGSERKREYFLFGEEVTREDAFSNG